MGDLKKNKETVALPKFVQNEDGVLEVQVNSEEPLRFIFGTESDELAKGLTKHCLKALHATETDEQVFMVAAVKEISPRDGLEGMLATQMAAIHVATTRSARFLANASTRQQVEAHERCLNRLARTFAAQIEALRKYRNGGEQKVTVQHVNVSDGGQAIVGNVAHRGRGRTKNER